MKLNKSIIFGLAAISGVIISSCTTEWLDTAPNQNVNIEQYYTTDAAIQEAVVAAYDPLKWFDYFYTYNDIRIQSDVIADQCLPGGGDPTDAKENKAMFNFNIMPTQVMNGNYSAAYSGVKRCNDAIHYMNDFNVEDLTEANRKYYEAQCRVLRAFYYNQLWKWWGNIIYYTENLSGNFLGTQYTADEVYNFIITDLEEVFAMNALEWKSPITQAGRVTTPMAYMLYTEMVMYQNDKSRYPQALNYMKEIINSAEYSLYPDFSEIWDVDHEWCDESIWEINYSDTGARSWDNPLGAGGSVSPKIVGARNYNMGDGIHEAGWGWCTIRQSWVDRYDPADLRLAATVWTPEEGSYQKGDQDTGHFIGKYAPMIGGNVNRTGGDADLNYNNNVRVYRYAEVLLNAAELAVDGAGSGEAQSWLDQVRSRAGLGTVAATKDNIIEERAFEFLGEGKRYWDLIRTGLASSVLVPSDEVVNDRTGSYSDSKKYIPFPQSEIDQAQGTITQNPY